MFNNRRMHQHIEEFQFSGLLCDNCYNDDDIKHRWLHEIYSERENKTI